MRLMRAVGVICLILVFAGQVMGEAPRKVLMSHYVEGPIPVDPEWPRWGQIPSVEVALLAQAIAKPFNLTPSIPSIEVKSVHNGAWIAFLIAWKDATKDVTMYTDKFRDAVAVMTPVEGPTDITMGKPGGRVLVLHWKADWQEDIDRGFQDIARLYPNFWLDWYPFVPGEPPYDVTAWTNPEAQRYMTGWVLGNPRSQPQKRTAVEEQIAEGFSTLTTNFKQNAVGKGVWANGEWKVVITRPFAAGDPNDPRWEPGKETTVAFAAWDGGKGEIGARKAFSDWVALKIGPIGR